MSEIEEKVWSTVANARTHKEVNYIIWSMVEDVVSIVSKSRDKE